jgi:hypothetical protein
MLNDQTHPNFRLLFVAHGDNFDFAQIEKVFRPHLHTKILHLPAEDTVLADGLNLALKHVETDLVAKIDDDDYYGPNYLFDAALAFNYSSAGLVGKGTYFCYVESCEKMGLRFSGKHFRFTERVHGGTLVWDRLKTGNQEFERVRQGTDTAFLRALNARSIPILSIDPFNFIHVRYANKGQHTWKVEDEEFLRNVKILKNSLDLSLAFS